MYKVTLYDNPEGRGGTVIHSPNVNDLKVEGTIKKEINLIDSFNFTMYLNNPGYGRIRPFQTFIHVLNTKTNKLDFKGRVYGPAESMGTDGNVSVSYLCEGELSYLHDSQQRHLEFRGTTREAFETILHYHNRQVEEYKHFQVGNIEIQDPNDYMYFYLSADQDTFDALKEKLIDKLGGELQIRNENGVRYLDWLHRVGYDSDTEIRLAKNLKSISKDVDPSEIVTRLTPLGTRIESEDEEATDASEARLTIESINNGLPYIDRPDLIEIFGIQGGAQVWDDVTTVQRLMTNGRNWLNNQKEVLEQFEIEALDLSLIGLDFDSFEMGNSHPVTNPIMSIIDERLRIVGTTIDINSPEGSGLTIGDKIKKASEYQADAARTTRRVQELQSELSYERARGQRTRAQLIEQTNEMRKIIEEIDTSEMPLIRQSLEDINGLLQELEQDIGDIPVYTLATPNNDGLMSMYDKQKLDTLEIPDYTEEFRIINEELTKIKGRLDTLEGTPPEDPIV
jgi:hypothetical protein